MSASRQEVFEVIEGERDYQDAVWGPHHDREHSITEFLVYMRDYVEQALHDCTRLADEIADPKALDAVRKVAALGVACMEVHGAPKRKRGSDLTLHPCT